MSEAASVLRLEVSAGDDVLRQERLTRDLRDALVTLAGIDVAFGAFAGRSDEGRKGTGRCASKRCREVLAGVAAGRADLVLIRDVSRLSENFDQLREIVSAHRHRIAISRDDADQFR